MLVSPHWTLASRGALSPEALGVVVPGHPQGVISMAPAKSNIEARAII